VGGAGAQSGVGKRSLLDEFSVLVLNKEIVGQHPDGWTEEDVRARADALTEAVISVWPGPV
jgi:hypothetical protein